VICYIEVPFIDSDLLYRGALQTVICYIEVPFKADLSLGGGSTLTSLAHDNFVSAQTRTWISICIYGVVSFLLHTHIDILNLISLKNIT
jgi:hypothetical protein